MKICPNCRGAISEPGVADGYAVWCYCGALRLATLTPQNTNSAEPTAKPDLSTPEQKHPVGLLPHQERVVKERDELAAKTEALDKFQKTVAFGQLPIEERLLLWQQSACMRDYKEVLDLRIKWFVRG